MPQEREFLKGQAIYTKTLSIQISKARSCFNTLQSVLSQEKLSIWDINAINIVLESDNKFSFSVFFKRHTTDSIRSQI